MNLYRIQSRGALVLSCVLLLCVLGWANLMHAHASDPILVTHDTLSKEEDLGVRHRRIVVPKGRLEPKMVTWLAERQCVNVLESESGRLPSDAKCFRCPSESVFRKKNPAPKIDAIPGFVLNLEADGGTRDLHTLIQQGLLHFYSGYDHICFVLLVVLIALSFRECLGVITCFTFGHACAFAFKNYVAFQIPGSWIEAGIAMSLLALSRPQPDQRRSLIFQITHRLLIVLWGLIHGLALSSEALATLVNPRDVLAYHLALELSQITSALLFRTVLEQIWKRYPTRRSPLRAALLRISHLLLMILFGYRVAHALIM